MRTPRQQLYDKFYYNFERWIFAAFQNARAFKRVTGKKFSREFYKTYRTVIRPYWKQFGVRSSLLWVKDNYLITGDLDPRYIPYDLYITKILPHFNPLIFTAPLSDKNLSTSLYPQAKHPETVFKYMSGQHCLEDYTPISFQDALARIEPEGRYVVKPSRDSSEGKGVRFFTGGEDAAALLASYRGIDYIVQRAVVQHPDIAALNPTSVNTIRIITLLFHGKATVLSAILRVGSPGSQVDNMGAGGLCFPIHPDGAIETVACAYRDGRVAFIDRTGDPLYEGYRVPSYDRVSAAAAALAEKTPHIKYIAWDFAVDDAGDPVLIEFNISIPGQNQENCGPTFGDLTDQVLAEVFGKKEKP